MKKEFDFRHYFLFFLLYNSAILGWQLLYSFINNSSFMTASVLPLYVYFEIFIAVVIHFALYLLLSFIQTIILRGITEHHPNHRETIQISLVLLSLLILFSVNCYFFPLSQFSHFFLPLLSPFIVSLIAFTSSLIFIILFVYSLIKLFIEKPKLTLSVFSILALIGFMAYRPQPIPNLMAKPNKPNIIIIGIDSLSLRQVNAKLTPNLYHFLQNSVHFNDTVSPLAHTFPAWVTLLTGLYPLHHNARENLVNVNGVRADLSIAWTLKKLGYTTIFATDDRRFNNLDKEFGFQEIIGPSIGINELLLGSFYDYPMTNLLINSPVSKWLLPYNYSNRAGHFSYYPATFNHLLQTRLNQLTNDKPLFFGVHFTLPHWPYAWAVTQLDEIGDAYDIHSKENLYRQAVHEADKQVGILLHYFRKTGALKNSLVIMLSDHGEVMYKEGSRKINLNLYQESLPSPLINYFQSKTSTEPTKSVGHGTDLLSPEQYHAVLGFQIFQQGKLINLPKIINTRVALFDIAPTILDFIHQPLPKNLDGITLLKTIITQVSLPSDRIFMLESGMLPNQFLTQEKTVYYGKLYFKVNPDTYRIEIKEQGLAAINTEKLYGILNKNWLLVLYPDGTHYITVILDLNTGAWSDKTQSQFVKASPFETMLKALLQFYKHDLSLYPEVKSNSLIPQIAAP